jgi:molecular chaperone GrpE
MNQQDRQAEATAPPVESAVENRKPSSPDNPFADEQDEVTVKETDELLSLRAELEQSQLKAEENWNLYLGARAEAENIKRRAERDVQNAHKYALEKFIGELLPVKDSLELGISAANETTDIEKIKEGSELTLKMFAAAIEKFGVQEVDPIGTRFNPELHEAMAMQPSQEAEPNTVLQVIQKGYLLNERLVRPALVIVAQTG